ncbi:MAG TPA: hypothetical protein VFZ11_04810 [Gemmatimonadaceae bacterium]
MFAKLALRNVTTRPWRTVLLLAGYGIGVGVMIVLLSIGEALLAQARDERLVGGGDVTVLPEGLDVEVMKTGGVGGLFFSIDHARFVHLQLLASPRLAGEVRAVAPQIEGKLLYLRANGREHPVRASGEIPSASRAVGGAPALAAGAWTDDAGDVRWTSPTRSELRHDIDRFHLPPDGVASRESWAEWHYFNVLSADLRRWAFITYMVGGEVPDGRWGGQLLVTTHEQGRPARRFSATVPPADVRFSTVDAGLRLGDARVTLLEGARYHITGSARAEDGSGERVTLDLVVTPAPRAYFPGASLGSGDFVSGYAVAGLRADATGTLCVGARCERFDGVQAYHDHNWGVWRGVSWEWGSARAGEYSLLYGRVIPPDSLDSTSPLFLYVVDSLGFRALFRPDRIVYDDARTIAVDGRPVRVPARAVMEDVRGGDTLRVELEIEDAVGTDTRASLVERGETMAARALRRPYFIQMKGIARLTGRLDGRPVVGTGTGFFETYR